MPEILISFRFVCLNLHCTLFIKIRVAAMKLIKTFLTLALTGIFLAPAAIADDRTVGGYVAYIPDHTKEIVLPDGRKLVHTTLRGVLIEDDPKSPIHLLSQDCAGTDLIGSDGTPQQIGGACAAIDSDGDIMRISYLNTPPNGTWHYTGGTGKFAGVEGGGTSEVIALGPDGRFTLRYQGQIILNSD
jgi:hypothetical protein